jgi:hypothetical protein
MLSTTTCTGASHTGKAPGVLLDQDADEALQAADDGAVQHHRPVAGAVFAHIFGVQPLGHGEVHLHGAALPLAAQIASLSVYSILGP